MSLICLTAFLYAAAGNLPADDMTNEFFIIWALFAIADALWTRRFVK